MIAGTLSRYFGLRFLTAVLAVFAGTLVLTAMIDFLEMMRRTGDIKDVSAFFIAKITFFRVPFITERVMPFAVLVGAMFCYLNLSRRLELVVARAAGVSAWQFITPAIIIARVDRGRIRRPSTIRSRPTCANNRRVWKPNCSAATAVPQLGSGFWLRQRSEEGQAVINAKSSRQQGVQLGGVTHLPVRAFRPLPRSHRGQERDTRARILAARRGPVLCQRHHPGRARNVSARTSLTPVQVGESFATPETVPFWQLASYIDLAENAGVAAAGYRLQYYQLLAQPLLPHRHGAPRRRGQFALLPFRGRAEGRFGRHRRRIHAVRPGKDYRRLEQGRD